MDHYNKPSPDDLMHYGIQGQKWGVRRGPPYPIEDKVMSKGTRLNSISYYKDSSQYKKSGRWMYAYNPDDEWDSKVYKGPFSIYKMQTAKQYVFEHSFETTKDLKMPTKKERIDEFIKLYNNDKRMVVKDLVQMQKAAKRVNIDQDRLSGLNVRALKTKSDYEKAYILLNHAMENVNNFKTTKKYAEIMSTKYDAMVDDNNQGWYNMTHDPVIIFRTNEVLKEIGDARMIELNEVQKNYDDVTIELMKKGRQVML